MLTGRVCVCVPYTLFSMLLVAVSIAELLRKNSTSRPDRPPLGPAVSQDLLYEISF